MLLVSQQVLRQQQQQAHKGHRPRLLSHSRRQLINQPALLLLLLAGLLTLELQQR